MIPYKFVRDAFEILKPLISSNQKTRVIYERYFLDREEQRWTEMKPPVSLSSSEEEEEEEEEELKRSIFDLSAESESESDEEADGAEEVKNQH